jgi:hypothetical protein
MPGDDSTSEMVRVFSVVFEIMPGMELRGVRTA